jgi:hypothetical protein
MQHRRRRRRRNPSEQGWLAWALAAGLVGLGALALTRTEWARLSRLEPDTRRRVETLIARLRARGIEVLIGSTRRSETEQAQLVAEGKSANTISWHNSGRAVDLYPLVDGKPDYNATRPDLFRIMHQEWAALGGTGLAYSPYPNGPNRLITTYKNGKAIKVWDGGHVEYRGGFASAAEAYRATA